MLSFATLALSLALSVPNATAEDIVVTKEKHSDAMKMPGREEPAKDTTEVTWIGKDRLRTEEGDSITIVRADLKKLYMIDKKAKTYSAVDLPIDMKKYMPPEAAPMLEQMASQSKVTLTPTTETKAIGDWTATRFTLVSSMPMGGSITQELWVVKDVGVDLSSWREMAASIMASNPFAGSMAAEMKKVDGFPVMSERTMKMMGSESKATEKVKTIEHKEPAAGLYDVPEGYTEKPFDPMAGMMMGGPGAGHSRPRGS